MKRLIAISLFFTTLSITGCTSSPTLQQDVHQTEYQTYVKTGEGVPMTQFTDTQGNQINLNQSQNVKLLVLFATWCPDSQRAIKALIGSEFNLDPNIDIIAIGREENKQTLDKFAAEYEINFPLVTDTDRSIYAKFANAGIPRLILLDKDNRIVKTIIAEGENPLAEVQW
ncbi:redoxin domain-containing protein [Shewanella sp. VB17]|uniref:TlpA family protein disulfide reductase n=1 Tax=Shewanella sp. VB17 TaxID=2739432 RepID=UPI00156512F3|nr:TlpA disulfide reductase family protein [Shewanella sp. VB17]NRD75711.1 redoxin domain-containing protein [Shewanella sp. VB17]